SRTIAKRCTWPSRAASRRRPTPLGSHASAAPSIWSRCGYRSLFGTSWRAPTIWKRSPTPSRSNLLQTACFSPDLALHVPVVIPFALDEEAPFGVEQGAKDVFGVVDPSLFQLLHQPREIEIAAL